MVITPSDDRIVSTPAAQMTGLATPSTGTNDLATWRVELPDGGRSPEHTIDREQVWMPVSGVFQFTIDGVTEDAAPGQAVIVPADSLRQFTASGGPAEALVCMVQGGTVGVPGQDGRQPLPWAA